jgi:hypothetical protein
MNKYEHYFWDILTTVHNGLDLYPADSRQRTDQIRIARLATIGLIELNPENKQWKLLYDEWAQKI